MSKHLGIRLSDREWEVVREGARACGMSLTQWAKMRLFGAWLGEEELREKEEAEEVARVAALQAEEEERIRIEGLVGQMGTKRTVLSLSGVDAQKVGVNGLDEDEGAVDVDEVAPEIVEGVVHFAANGTGVGAFGVEEGPVLEKEVVDEVGMESIGGGGELAEGANDAHGSFSGVDVEKDGVKGSEDVVEPVFGRDMEGEGVAAVEPFGADGALGGPEAGPIVAEEEKGVLLDQVVGEPGAETGFVVAGEGKIADGAGNSHDFTPG